MISLRNIVLTSLIRYYLQNYLKDAGIYVLIPEAIEDDSITFSFDSDGVNYDTLKYLIDPSEEEASDRFMIEGHWFRVELIEEGKLRVTNA